METAGIRGVVVPILTPLTADERLDAPSLRRLVGYLLANGVHGIWASGTTGEFANLPDEERLATIEAVVDEVAGRVPVIANISCPSTGLTASLGRRVRGMDLAGVAATPPYYYPSGQDELLEHFRRIRDQVGLPLWVYNIPQNVKTAVEPGTIVQLAAEGTVVGVKDSSGAGEALAHLVVLCQERGVSLLRFLAGVFRVTSAGAVGAHGVIPGIANLVPEEAAMGWEAGEAGDADTARRCDAKLLRATSLARLARGGVGANNVVVVMKAALKGLGILDSDTVSRPLRPLTDEEKRAIAAALKELGLRAAAATP